jgi:hypothetical protein
MTIKNAIKQLSKYPEHWELVLDLNFAEVTEQESMAPTKEFHRESYKAGYEDGVSTVEGIWTTGFSLHADQEMIGVTAQEQTRNP